MKKCAHCGDNSVSREELHYETLLVCQSCGASEKEPNGQIQLVTSTGDQKLKASFSPPPKRPKPQAGFSGERRSIVLPMQVRTQ
jgi:hypothetical protein